MGAVDGRGGRVTGGRKTSGCGPRGAGAVSPLRKGETVEVLAMAQEDVCSRDMLGLIRWQGRNMAVPLSQLAGKDVDESTLEAIGHWHYWVAQYCL